MRVLAVGLGLPLTVLAGLSGATSAVSAADPPDTSPRPQLSAYRFLPQPLTPGRAGYFRFVTTREGGATITLARQRAGRRGRGGGCVVPAKARTGAMCLRAVPVGRLRFAVDTGEGSHRFDGRIGGRRLAPGRYRATLRVLNDAFGDSDPAYVTVRIAAR